MKQCGDDGWSNVAAKVPGRTKEQCRRRWVEQLNPTRVVRSIDPRIRTGYWTLDEDKTLIGAMKGHGISSWTAIAAEVPGRSVGQCRNRWNNSLAPNAHEWLKKKQR